MPLPQEEKPMCKTLFSFKSKDKGEDRDCLIFNKVFNFNRIVSSVSNNNIFLLILMNKIETV